MTQWLSCTKFNLPSPTITPSKMNTSLLYENSSRITRSLLGLGEYGRSYLEHPSAGVTGFSNSTSPADDEYLNSYFAEVTAISDPSYLTVYQWEHFELRRWRKWMGNYWSLSIYASLVYLIVIFSVQRFMKNREPFNLRGLLTCWNFALAAFSIMGFLRTGNPTSEHETLKSWFNSVDNFIIRLILLTLTTQLQKYSMSSRVTTDFIHPFV